MDRSKLKIFSFFVGISLFLIILDKAGKIDFLTFPLRRFFMPVQNIYNDSVEIILSPFNFFRFVKSGEERIRFLEKKNLELASMIEILKVTKKENEELRKQLGFNFSKNHLLIPATVLGIDRFMEVGLEAGENLENDKAVIYEDAYIGRLIKNSSGIGYVQLVSDFDSKVPAKTSNATGIVTGEFSVGVVLDKVSKSETISVGETVFTSGLGGNAPANLLIGKISKVEPTENELFSRAIVEPFVESKKLKTVYIVVD